MRQPFLLPLLLCATLASAQSPSPNTGSPVLRSLSAGHIERVGIYEKGEDWKTGFDDVIRSFEPPEACEGFALTEGEVRDFFRKARPLSELERKSIEYSSLSRCVVKGDMALRGGVAARWLIDRARNATLQFPGDSSASPADRILYFYCDRCEDEKYYSPTGQKLSDWRPVTETIFIDDNAAWPEDHSSTYAPPDTAYTSLDSCTEFTLTEEDVREFFSTARASSRFEYQQDANVPRCYANGRTVLQDGRTARWRIDQGRRGEIWFFSSSLGALSTTIYFYCARCLSDKYFEPCDVDCVAAKARERLRGDLPPVEERFLPKVSTSD